MRYLLLRRFASALAVKIFSYEKKIQILLKSSFLSLNSGSLAFSRHFSPALTVEIGLYSAASFLFEFCWFLATKATTCMMAVTLLFFSFESLKGLSHEIYGPVFWAVWMYLGPNVNRLWFLNFNDAPLILDNSFKFWCVSGQTFSEILRISEKNWQLSLRFSNFRRFSVSGSLIFVDFWLAVLRETLLKGTVARDFRPLLFSIKRTYLGPWYIS